VTATRPVPRPRSGSGRVAVPIRRGAPPILVRQIRNGIVESVHRGDVVEVDASGRIIRLLGDPDRMVTLRSCVKPFGLLALIQADEVDTLELTAPEIAIMASSHSGEDIHVRTIQGMYRRAGVSQSVLACGAEGMPLDALTAARLARDGEKAGPVRHMCSGQHSSMILLARLRGWPLEDYWHDDHPAQVAYRAAVAAAFAVKPGRLVSAIDGCGVSTFAFPLREVAQAYALLADPESIPPGDPRRALAPALRVIRDAMLAHPEMVGGSRERLDTSLMKALPRGIVSKGGMEALRGLGIVPGPRTGNGRTPTPATGMAIKIEDGDGHGRGTWAATIEALHQAGVLGGGPLRELARYHRPVTLDPHGRIGAEAIADFELAPVGELIG
jgi:L-asparaginase II